MDEYEKEMFSFLTRRENFENILKLFDHSEMVRKNLLTEFWDLVFEKLGKKVKDTAWILDKEDYSYRWAQIYLYKKEWETNQEKAPFCISWESMLYSAYYGIWINGDSKIWDMDAIRNYLSGLIEAKGGQKNHNWAYQVNARFDFISLKGVSPILPDQRDEIAEEFANTLFELTERFGLHLDKAFKMKLK